MDSVMPALHIWKKERKKKKREEKKILRIRLIPTCMLLNTK